MYVVHWVFRRERPRTIKEKIVPEDLPLVTELAKSMFKRGHMPTWSVSANRLWRAQDPETRKYWIERAREVIADLAKAGYEIKGL